MLVNLVGIAKLDFTSGDGKNVVGTQLFVNLPDPNVNGLAVAKLFIGQNITLPANLAPGVNLDVQFNNKGKVVSVAPVPAKFPATPTKA